MKETLLHELHFCLNLREKEGGCTFGGGTTCAQCAVPYLILKLLTDEVLHGNMERLSLADRKQKINELENI